jgi:hypothetical protein
MQKRLTARCASRSRAVGDKRAESIGNAALISKPALGRWNMTADIKRYRENLRDELVCNTHPWPTFRTAMHNG